jgi:tetratricopeptide (TPR) repeat protein
MRRGAAATIGLLFVGGCAPLPPRYVTFKEPPPLAQPDAAAQPPAPQAAEGDDRTDERAPDGSDLDQLVDAADRALQDHEYAKAEDLANEVIARDPAGYPYAYVALGDALVALSRVDEGLAMYQRALQLEPDDGWAAQQTAEAIGKLGRHRDALQFLRTFAASHPGADAELFDALGWLELDYGTRAAAEKAFGTSVVKSNKSDPDAYYGLAVVAADRGQIAKARDALKALFAIDPARREEVAKDEAFSELRRTPSIAALLREPESRRVPPSPARTKP